MSTIYNEKFVPNLSKKIAERIIKYNEIINDVDNK